MRYFVAAGEDRRLDDAARSRSRGCYVALSDGVTQYELAGPEQGELIVLIGGLTVPLYYWDGLAHELHTRNFRTLAFAAYGRGQSDRVRGAYDEALFVRQLRELLDKLAVTAPYHLVGTSMGALVAMVHASGQPNTIASLTLTCPAGLSRRSAWLYQVLQSDRFADFAGRRYGRGLFERHLASETREIRDPARARALDEMVRDAYQFEGSIYALIETLACFPLHGRSQLYRRTGDLARPTMLVWGADDKVTEASGMETARALLRPRECRLIEGCGHMVPFERPHDLADQIASFTAAVSTDRSES